MCQGIVSMDLWGEVPVLPRLRLLCCYCEHESSIQPASQLSSNK